MKKSNRTEGYTRVSENVYFTGTSYRTRVTLNGKMTSKSFKSKRNAIAYRNQLQKLAA